MEVRSLSLAAAVLACVAVACGGASVTAPQEPLASPVPPQESAEERLLDLWYALFVELVPVWQDTGLAWRQRFASAEQEAAVASLERSSEHTLRAAGTLFSEMDRPRCAQIVPLLRAQPVGRYASPRWSASSQGDQFTLRAEAVEQLLSEALAGLGDPCLYARQRVAGRWHVLTAHLEARDGREAAFAGADGDALRADVEQLDALERRLGEIGGTRAGDRSLDELAAELRAVRDGIVEILGRWSPNDPRVAGISDVDLARRWGARSFAEAYQELDARVWRTRVELERERAPPVRGRSAEARWARALLEAALEGDSQVVRAARSPGTPELRSLWPAPTPDELVAICEGGTPAPVDDYEVSWRRPLEEYSCAQRDVDAEGFARAARELDYDNDEQAQRDVSSVSAGLRYGYACDEGHRESCTRHALFLMRAPAEWRDDARAFELLRAECTENIVSDEGASACAALGSLLREARGAPRDLREAASVLARSCWLGHGCATWFEMIETGEAAAPDDPWERLDALRSMCTRGGVSGACRGAADLLVAGSPERDLARALSLYERGCYGDDADACHRGAVALLHGGEGRAAGAAALFARGCELGNGPSCPWAASLDRVRSPDAARVRAEAACLAGNPDGCAVLGELESRSARGRRRARERFDAACEAGSSLGCERLASLTRDPARARELLRRACEDDDGVALGCERLAELARRHSGDPPDAELAAEATRRACAAGAPIECAASAEEAGP